MSQLAIEEIKPVVRNIGVVYVVIPTDQADEAESLAFYLNEHGVAAFVQADNEVNCPLEHGQAGFDALETLRTTWRMFWDNSDSGLFGLPMYVKG